MHKCFIYVNHCIIRQLNRQRRVISAAKRHSINDCQSIQPAEQLTLRKIELWIREPCIRLEWLSIISEACQDKKGGALASEIFRFKGSGNKTMQVLVHDLLVAVCAPMQYMLSKWLLEGEINDPHSEFFIEILPEIGTDRLWSDKYRVRESMLPSFISRELAYKILVTGKSINFVKEICEEKTSIKGKKELEEYFESNGNDILIENSLCIEMHY